ncbi:MAG: hypothetical protein JNL76_07755 [Alphaproteobacteria bacterium]|nr:hypothetical protein [Alphaproteobacteria bacterium]
MTEAAQKTVRLSDAFASSLLIAGLMAGKKMHNPPGTQDTAFRLNKERALEIIFIYLKFANKETLGLPNDADFQALAKLGIAQTIPGENANGKLTYDIGPPNKICDFELAFIDRSEERDASPPFYAQITLLEPNHP